MFLGHYGLAFAAKRAAPSVSLGALVFAAQFLDLLWPILMLAGVEQVRIVPGLMRMSPFDFVYPWSHSLLTVALWGTLIGAVAWRLRRDRRDGAPLVLGLLVVSHWFLDVLTHRPDLPLWPGSSPLFGLGLWNSFPLTVIAEMGIFAVGVTLYSRATRPRDAIGRWGLRSMVGFLLAIFLGGLDGAAPPSQTAVAIVTLGLWLFIPWARWVDRHRELLPARPRGDVGKETSSRSVVEGA